MPEGLPVAIGTGVQTDNPSGGEAAGEASGRAWLLALQDCVRMVDYQSGRRLFADDVVAFGSRVNLLHGLDDLQAAQWSGVWPNISEFSFTLQHLDCRRLGDALLLVVPWTSTGYHPDGASFDRPGRATVVLHRRGDVWLAVHTHFSLTPGTPTLSQRPAG
ncbi:MAG: YybH family protein [Dehalococcoidia bacterium]